MVGKSTGVLALLGVAGGLLAAGVAAESAGPAEVPRGLDEGLGAVLALGRGGVIDHQREELLGDLDEGLGLLGVEAVADGCGDLLPGGVTGDDAGAAEPVNEEGSGLVDDAMRCGVHEMILQQTDR